MRGPYHAYAVHGHSRYVIIFSQEGKYITGITIGGPDIMAMVGNAVIEITRAQTADIIRQHRKEGYIVKTEVDHSDRCACTPGDIRMIPHYTCAHDAPCKQEGKAS